MNERFLRSVLLVAIWCMWVPSIAFAAALDYERELGSVGGIAVFMNSAIAVLSGLTALLQRVRQELANEGGALPHPAIFCAANITGSLLAGFLGFGLSRSMGHSSIWLEMVVVGSFSFTGARLVENVAERLLDRIVPGAMSPVRERMPRGDFGADESAPAPLSARARHPAPRAHIDNPDEDELP